MNEQARSHRRHRLLPTQSMVLKFEVGAGGDLVDFTLAYPSQPAGYVDVKWVSSIERYVGLLGSFNPTHAYTEGVYNCQVTFPAGLEDITAKDNASLTDFTSIPSSVVNLDLSYTSLTKEVIDRIITELTDAENYPDLQFVKLIQGKEATIPTGEIYDAFVAARPDVTLLVDLLA